jgi:hypothetical protein
MTKLTADLKSPAVFKPALVLRQVLVLLVVLPWMRRQNLLPIMYKYRNFKGLVTKEWST